MNHVFHQYFKKSTILIFVNTRLEISSPNQKIFEIENAFRIYFRGGGKTHFSFKIGRAIVKSRKTHKHDHKE